MIKFLQSRDNDWQIGFIKNQDSANYQESDVLTTYLDTESEEIKIMEF